ncbi:hypothetical protein [Amycolatopsis sp. NPDC051371]|uniref:hypothetical protein n=1 Tax=Amycolatopsis sp. NPDC051371 TaxID=3155800 RepID=UPI003415BACE
MIIIGLRAWLGTDDWAGLGQWVGGLGAFYAALVALQIARDEAGRENRREAERLRVQAYYVRAAWVHVGKPPHRVLGVKVENAGSEPVLDVQVVASHKGDEVLPLVVKDSPKHVLLPAHRWFPNWNADTSEIPVSVMAMLVATPAELEIAFTDLGGMRWRRIGERPPTLVPHQATLGR